MTRKRHPKKEVEEAIRYAEEHGWKIEVGAVPTRGENEVPLQREGLSMWHVLYSEYFQYTT